MIAGEHFKLDGALHRDQSGSSDPESAHPCEFPSDHAGLNAASNPAHADLFGAKVVSHRIIFHFAGVLNSDKKVAFEHPTVGHLATHGISGETSILSLEHCFTNFSRSRESVARPTSMSNSSLYPSCSKEIRPLSPHPSQI